MPDNDAKPSFAAIIDWATKASLGTLLLAILALGQMGVWVWGSQFEAMRAERDEWRSIALKATNLAETSSFRVIGEENPVEVLQSRIQVLEAGDVAR